MLRKATLTLSAAAAVALGAPAAASAATLDPATGSGFVGKGEIQTAYGWNNTTLQKNASGVTFSSSQDAIQALSQSGTQAGTQVVTQSVLQEVSCTIETGGVKNKKTFYRDGEREGERTGTREGSRDGTRSGTLVGALRSSIAYDPRVKNQITGFNLTGFRTPGVAFVGTGANQFGEWELAGQYSFGEATLGDVTWGGWGEDAAECLGNNPHIVEGSLVNEITESDVNYDDITHGAINAGTVISGAVTATGALQLFASHNNVVKPLVVQ